jgi:uncharacterized protein (DUF2235 family)
MPRQIVVCSDGTWNTVDNKDRGKPAPTNVYKTFLALTRPQDRVERGSQREAVTSDLAVLYDPGVGTASWFERVAGGAFGVGLSENVMDGYEFLAKHYEDGARIYLFGFSRGAFTARSLGGMIAKCGVLPRAGLDRASIEHVYAEVYCKHEVTAEQHRETSRRQGITLATPDIEMVGVWDTVGALGIPTSIFHAFNRRLESFHDTRLNAKVLHGYHAVALDEARKAFTPTLWDDRAGIEQVWFAGVHSNVGGGYQDTGLSDIALEWMLAKAQSRGLQVDRKRIEPPLAPNFAGELRDSRSGLMALARVEQRDVAGSDRDALLHGSVLRRIADRASAYDSVALRNLRPENVTGADGTAVPAPQDYACRVCDAEKSQACGPGACAVRHKASAAGHFVAATCTHQG